MRNLAIALVGLAALAFLLAVVSTIGGAEKPVLGISAEAFSRASSNLALLGIA